MEIEYGRKAYLSGNDLTELTFQKGEEQKIWRLGG